MKNDPPNTSDNLNDLLFAVRYIPRMLSTMTKYGLFGAMLGFGTSYLFPNNLDAFAQENHDAIDFQDKYVANDDEFLRLSRNEHFDKITPPISEFLPIYSTLLGAGAGAFFGLNKGSNEFYEKLKADREERASRYASV